MVTAVFAVTPGLDIKLPEAEEAQAPEKENLFIVVDQDGNMKLNHKDVTFATLKDELQEKRRLLDNTTMMIIRIKNTRETTKPLTTATTMTQVTTQYLSSQWKN